MLRILTNAGHFIGRKGARGPGRPFDAGRGMVILILLSLPAVSAAEEPSAPPAKPSMPDEIIFESSVGNVLFPHKAHLKKKCASCHHQIHAQQLTTPHEEYLTSSRIHCKTCHTANSEYTGKYYKCSYCHHSEPENIADETLSSKVVVHKICWQCHETGTGVEASEGCIECHVKAGTVNRSSAESTDPGQDSESQRGESAKAAVGQGSGHG